MKPLDYFRGAPPAPRPQAALPVPTTGSSNRALFRTAALVIGLGLGLFLLWAVLAPLNKGATAPGRLDVTNSRVTVQNLDGGIIERVLVRDGDTVKAGQTLARMDARQLQIQVQQYDTQQRQRLIERAVLNAEITGRPVVLPPEVAGAVDGDTAVYRSVQVSALQSRNAARNSEKAALREQINRLSQQAVGLEGQVEAYRSQIALIDDEVTGLEDLFKRGYASKTRLLALKREKSRLEGEMAATRSAINQARVQQSEARQRISQVDSRALDAAGQRLAQVEQELALNADRIAAQKLALERTDVKSPIDGVVLARAVSQPGSVIRPGDPILQLVPAGALQVKAQLNPRDVESVAIGSPATLRFSGLNMQRTPTLKGKVTYVSADTLADSAQTPPYYEMRVEVDAAEREKLSGVPLTSGMPVEVMVDAGSRTAFGYLTEPLVAIFARSFRE